MKKLNNKQQKFIKSILLFFNDNNEHDLKFIRWFNRILKNKQYSTVDANKLNRIINTLRNFNIFSEEDDLKNPNGYMATLRRTYNIRKK